MAGYRRYDLESPASPIGWDAWASDYARLGEENRAYALGKELLHSLVDRTLPPPRDREAWALDFNCGAGDDIVRLLARGWRVAGCDGSPGMLHAAATRSAQEAQAGRVELWQGQAEQIDIASFGGRKFELIFSTTGGFTYLTDEAFVKVHRVLAEMLAPGGALVLAHLTPFCAAESLYHLFHLSLRAAVKRWRGVVTITVRGQSMTMRLRSPKRVRRLLADTVRIERMAPLLVCTPPFQSGFKPSRRAAAFLGNLERLTANASLLTAVADQVVCVARRL